MVLKLLVAMAGVDRFYDVGDRYECDDVSGQRLIGANRAVPWREPTVERAVVTAPERTTRRGR